MLVFITIYRYNVAIIDIDGVSLLSFNITNTLVLLTNKLGLILLWLNVYALNCGAPGATQPNGERI